MNFDRIGPQLGPNALCFLLPPFRFIRVIRVIRGSM